MCHTTSLDNVYVFMVMMTMMTRIEYNVNHDECWISLWHDDYDLLCHGAGYYLYVCVDIVISTGMVSFEIMLAHMFTQMLIVVVQIAVLLTVALLLFKVSTILRHWCFQPLKILIQTVIDYLKVHTAVNKIEIVERWVSYHWQLCSKNCKNVCLFFFCKSE